MGTISRRHFTMLAAGAAAGALHPKRAATQPGPNDRIRLGVVGCGMRGSGDMAELLQHPEVECVVVCDIDDAHLAKAVKNIQAQRGNTPETVKDFRRVMDRQDVDAVLVATPDHWHALPTILACQSGKDVYVEKPFARTIEEGRAIVQAAQEHRRIVQMGTQWRSGAHYAEAVEYFKSGKLGTLRCVRACSFKDFDITPAVDGPVPEGVDYEMWLGPAPQRPFNPNRFHRNFRWFWDYAGGLMTDIGVHVINLCQWTTGLESPRRISAMGGMRRLADTGIEWPDTQTVIYEFPNYTLTWEHQLRGSIGPNGRSEGAWFSGTNGTLYIGGGGWEVYADSYGNGLPEEKHEASDDPRVPHVQNFLDCIKSRRQTVSNPEVAHHVTGIAHLGNIAQRVGREILWDGHREHIENDPEADNLVAANYREPWKLPHPRG